VTKGQLRRECEGAWKRTAPPVTLDLGVMGTATPESLREVGLEPEPPARQPAPLVLRPALPFGRVLACAAALAGAGVVGTALLQFQRAELREIEYHTQRYLQALGEMQHLTELQILASEERERDLRAAIRRIEEYEAGAVRAERRARRLARKGTRP